MAPGSDAIGLDPARALDPAGYAIGGQAPRAALRPATREELAEALRAAYRDRLSVIPWGGGTWLGRGAAPSRYDLAVDFRGLDRVIEYDPEDLTITVECGVTLATLRRAVHDRGQELPIEGARADLATLGGALATNSSGTRRLAFGSPRDRILGARFALADGTLARTGGRVVKNVAGYGIHRLLCGSRGALAAFVEVSLKLLPAPAARRALVYTADGPTLRDARRWAFLPPLEPAAVTVLSRVAAARAGLGADADYSVVVILEDDAARVAQLADLVAGNLGAPARTLEGGDVIRLEQALVDAAESAAPRLEFVTAWNSPAALGVLLDASAVLDIVFQAPAGRLHLVPSSEDPASLVRTLAGASFQLVDADRRDGLDLLTGSTALADLRGRIRSALDPSGIWAFGPTWQAGLQDVPTTTDV